MTSDRERERGREIQPHCTALEPVDGEREGRGEDVRGGVRVSVVGRG